MSTQHKNLDLAKIHIPYNWSYADSAARLAATGFVAADVGKSARQTNDNSIWMLTDESPITWVRISGNLQLLETKTASASATLDFTSLSDIYNDYLLKITGIVPATNSVHLYMRFATDGTPTWDSGSNYRWGLQYWSPAALNGVVGDGGAVGQIAIGTSIANTAGYSINADIRLSNIRTAALYKTINSKAEYRNGADSNVYGVDVAGWWLNSSVKAFGIQLLMSSGNITSGAARLYGIVDS